MTKTLVNLTKAFIGESQARNRYSYYSKIAKDEGFEQIAAIFAETSEQERAHAKRLFEKIQGLKAGQNEIMVEAAAPATYSGTKDNLAAAIAGENYENSKMYPEFAKIAAEEGFAEISGMLLSIAKAEKHHEERYQKLLKELTAESVFIKDKETIWVCRECGYEHTGKEAPTICPACGHPQSYYQVKSEEY